jgi:hypothetical protein
MKNTITFVFLFNVCFSAVGFSAVGFTDVRNTSEAPLSTVNVTVDSRMELLAVVQFLSGYGKRYGLIARSDFPYKQDVKEYFLEYKSHPVVKLFDKMSAKGFSFDAPPAVMLYLSEPPELTVQLPFTNYLTGRAGGSEQLDKFVDLLRDFAKETEFMAFFKAHEESFRQITANARKKMKGTNHVKILEDYYGMRQNSYNIILVPLFVGGYGPRIKRTDGTYDIYSILGQMKLKDGLPVFGSESSFRYVVWHEFSHSFVNPTTAKFDREIDKYKALFEPISGKMSRQAYGNWQTCVNEHIVRAVTTRFTYREIGSDAGLRALNSERNRGFAYIQALCDRLVDYERHRDKYSTFVDFYPELIKVFKKFSEKDPGKDFYAAAFNGTINSVVSNKASVVLIVPTNEKDKLVQSRIQSFVENIKKRFYKDRPILTDKEALEKDLSKNSVVAYGTTNGNLFIAKYINEIPIKVESDKITADKVYKGTNLRFITTWPNPSNPERGMVFYTAQQSEDVLNINSVFHGPTDYVIAKATRILKSGNYTKKNGTWSLTTDVDTGTKSKRNEETEIRN